MSIPLQGAQPSRTIGQELSEHSATLESRPAEERVRWALDVYGERVVMTSSFGAQSAVTLHLVTRERPEIPVVLIDTGYLFPETYRFIDELTERLSLNLHVYRSELSPAWQEARFGKLWEQGIEGIEKYNRINKVDPMNQALRDLRVEAWISGVRRQQSETREKMGVLARQGEHVRIHPLIDWTDRDVGEYLTRHNLPYHPLWEQGYVSIGDIHTSHRLTDGMSESDARFFGLKRECGLHENVEGADYVI